jgi:hypothetical protein
MNFKKWVKSIQTAGYNGARTVDEVPQIKSQTMQDTLMNLGNTTLPQKYGDP